MSHIYGGKLHTYENSNALQQYVDVKEKTDITWMNKKKIYILFGNTG